ncbi:MAG: transporter associated domain-containing protein [Alphaproteobacteria bacterium]
MTYINGLETKSRRLFSALFRAERRLAEDEEDDNDQQAKALMLGLHFPAGEFHTPGGLVMGRRQCIPAVGDDIVESGYRLTVAAAAERALWAHRIEPEADAETRLSQDSEPLPSTADAEVGMLHAGATDHARDKDESLTTRIVTQEGEADHEQEAEATEDLVRAAE